MTKGGEASINEAQGIKHIKEKIFRMFARELLKTITGSKSVHKTLSNSPSSKKKEIPTLPNVATYIQKRVLAPRSMPVSYGTQAIMKV